jgi:hypothetical protein
VPPTVQNIRQEPARKNPDGTYQVSVFFDVVSQTPPNRLAVAINRNDFIPRRANPIFPHDKFDITREGGLAADDGGRISRRI